MSADMTARQMEVIAFINAHRAREQCNPTRMEIADHFGWASPTAAAEHLIALEKKGAIQSRYGKARGYIVLHSFQEVL